MQKKNYFPNITQAIVIVFLIFILQIGLSFTSGLLDRLLNINISETSTGIALINLISIGIVLFIFTRHSEDNPKEIFSLTSFPVKTIFPLILTVMGAGILISEIDNLFRMILPAPECFSQIMSQLTSGKSLWGSILALVIVAPITEEILVRGLFLNGFLKNYSVKKAVVFSAILFAFLHGNPWQLFGAFILGILFGWLVVETGSLLPGIIAHMFNNLLPILASQTGLKIVGYTTKMDNSSLQPLWFDGIGIILTAMGIWLLYRIFSEKNPKNLEAKQT